MVTTTTIAALLPVILWSIAVLFEKKLSTIVGNYLTSILLLFFGIIPILLAYLYYNTPLSTLTIIYSIISGVFFIIGAVFYYKSLETEQIANSSGTGLAQPLILLAFSLLILGEVLTLTEAVGGLIILFGVFLIITNQKFELNRKLIPAIIGNVAWAGYWIFASYAILSSNQVGGPLLISRVTALILGIICYKVFFVKSAPSKKSSGFKLSYVLLLGLILGIIDGAGNIIFGLVIKLNLLSLASIFTAAMPLFITGLGYLVYKERLTKLQAVGMGIAIIGALLLTFG